MRLTDLIVDPKSLGNKFWLVDISPSYQYENGKRTDAITGYRYFVCLPERGLEKVAIRIDGQKLMESPESGFIEVRFENLEVFIFWSRGDYAVGAKATNITLANAKA